MPSPSLSPSINPAKWNTAAKGWDKCDDVSVAIDKLSKAHLKIDKKALDLPQFNSFDDAKKGLAQLDADTKKLVDAAAAAARALEKFASANEADAKKKKPDAGKLLATIKGDAKGYADELDSAFDTARKMLLAATLALEAKAKKESKDAEKEGGDEGDGDAGALFNKVKGVFKDVAKFTPVPGKPSPFRFLITWANKAKIDKAGFESVKAAIFAGRSTFGTKQVGMHEDYLHVDKADGYSIGEVSWDATTDEYVFSCRGKIPKKAAVKLALTKQLGRTVNTRMRKLVKGKGGEETFVDATDADEEGGGPATVAATAAPAAAAAARTAAPGPKAGVSVPPLVQAAAKEFATARQTFVTEVTKFAKSLPRFYEDELRGGDKAVAKAVLDAKKRLEAAATRIPADLETTLSAMAGVKEKAQLDEKLAAARRQIQTLLALIDSDEVIKSLDGNELNRSLSVVKPLQLRLKAIEKVLPA